MLFPHLPCHWSHTKLKTAELQRRCFYRKLSPRTMTHRMPPRSNILNKRMVLPLTGYRCPACNPASSGKSRRLRKSHRSSIRHRRKEKNYSSFKTVAVKRVETRYNPIRHQRPTDTPCTLDHIYKNDQRLLREWRRGMHMLFNDTGAPNHHYAHLLQRRSKCLRVRRHSNSSNSLMSKSPDRCLDRSLNWGRQRRVGHNAPTSGEYEYH